MTESDQTVEERDRLLDLGKDGVIMCIDMSVTTGKAAVTDLAKISDEVKTALARFGDKVPDGFLLALYIPDVSERMIVGISARIHIIQSIKIFYDRALEFGNAFSFAIIPPSETIEAIIADLTKTVGSA
jgi:hypothetical protein